MPLGRQAVEEGKVGWSVQSDVVWDGAPRLRSSRSRSVVSVQTSVPVGMMELVKGAAGDDAILLVESVFQPFAQAEDSGASTCARAKAAPVREAVVLPYRHDCSR